MRVGPAGYPEEAKGKTEAVFALLENLGLSALEYAAVYGLRLSEESASRIGILSESNDIQMSMHAAYYISLASKDPQVRERSKQRLVQALRLAPLMQVQRIVFHAGGYSGHTQAEAYSMIKDAISGALEISDRKSKTTFLAPEIAGKTTAFGSPEELIRLCSEVEGCIPTIDWAHLYARSKGEVQTKEHYRRVLQQFEEALGKVFVQNMHFHVSGIVFGETGEREHRPLGGEWGPDILPLVELVLEMGYKPTFISETPDSTRGALYVKALLQAMEKDDR